MRRAAVVALGMVGHADHHQVINRLALVLLNETDPTTRQFAVMALGQLGGDRARGHLRNELPGASTDMRPWLYLALGLSVRNEPDRAQAVVDELVARLTTETGSDTLSAGLIGLGLTRSPSSFTPLVESLAAGPTTVSAQAALALGLSGHPGAQDILRDVIESAASPLVIRQAALASGILGDAHAAPALIRLVDVSNHAYVSRSATLGLAYLGDVDAVGSLIAIIEREQGQGLRAAFAVTGLGQLLDEDRRPALYRLAANDNYLSRPTAVEQLLKLAF